LIECDVVYYVHASFSVSIWLSDCFLICRWHITTYLQDPCRPRVRDAVELCINAGVKVCMCVAFMCYMSFVLDYSIRGHPPLPYHLSFMVGLAEEGPLAWY
jgi:hypothetical protein